jgi:predicted N-acetyltransferase YhbS
VPDGRPDLVIDVATESDLTEALAVQHAAFARVARMFGIPSNNLSAVRETLQDLRAFRDAGATILVARVGDRVVGTVRATPRRDGTVDVGRLAVVADALRRGVGRSLMRAVEDQFPEAGRFELFTGAEAMVPLALYRSMGYRVMRTEPGDAVPIVWLAKDRT